MDKNEIYDWFLTYGWVVLVVFYGIGALLYFGGSIDDVGELKGDLGYTVLELQLCCEGFCGRFNTDCYGYTIEQVGKPNRVDLTDNVHFQCAESVPGNANALILHQILLTERDRECRSLQGIGVEDKSVQQE